jgi:serine/threonine protein kinase
VAFLADRVTAEGQCRAVVKILRPAMAYDPALSSLVVQKEVVALQRLNDQVPPSPFVVRLLDTGEVTLERGNEVLRLPWIAIEYVHGGVEGTTLAKRVRCSIDRTGFAFDRARAARLVGCLTRALIMVHKAEVIHRDVKPDNVLCCGYGDDEIFKVADFGLARPSGLPGTFSAIAAIVGTQGYAPPEQLDLRDPGAIGPSTDVFALAATIFSALTGQPYFRNHRQMIDYLAAVARPNR